MTDSTCATCGGPLPTGKTRPFRYCSSECRRSAKAAALRERYDPRRDERTCIQCGAAFVNPGQGWYRCCSANCSKARERDRYRAKTYRRRTRTVGTYTLAEVAARSGSRCHLCRKPVDLSLSGMVPMGPTVDHLVPLSQGGADELTNVALAHRRCNVSRGVRGEVQLVLI